MPGLHLKDIHFPELRLPEMTRDDIAKALGDVRKEVGDVRRDLNEIRSEVTAPRVELARVEIPKFDLSKVEVPKEARKAARKASRQVTKAAQEAGLMKKPASRMPLMVAAAVTLALVGWALANSPTLKARLRSAAQTMQDRMAERNDWDRDEPQAFDAAQTSSVEPSSYAGALPAADSPFAEPPSDTPSGLGMGNGTHTISDDEPART